MDLREYASYDAVGLGALLRAGEVTAAEVEEAARRALRLANDRVNGLALPPFSPALAHDPGGPLAGVPFLIKDQGPVAEGVPFTIGSRALPGIVPGQDSDLMRRFRAAGLVTLGLTTVPEMAISFATESVRYGVTRNPRDPAYGAGGSSGGAAALVAAGAVPVAHGGDGAGSLRIPASCCGLVGLKPSRGRIPCGPDMGEPLFGMAYEFALTRTVRDAAHLLDAVAGPGVGDKYTAPPAARPYAAAIGEEPGRLRVAVTTGSWSGGAVDPEVAEAAVRAGRALAEMGHDVAEASPAIDWESVMEAVRAELAAVAAPFLLSPRRPDPAKLEAVSRRVLEAMEGLSAVELMALLNAQNRVSRAMGAFFTEYDLLVTPTLARPPLPHGTLCYDDPEQTVEGWLREMFDYGPFAVVFNVTGQPAISLPLAETGSGLPIGVQLVAPYPRDDLLLSVAARLEEALPQRPFDPF